MSAPVHKWENTGSSIECETCPAHRCMTQERENLVPLVGDVSL